MEDQEFQESEVIFSDEYYNHEKGSGSLFWNREMVSSSLENSGNSYSRRGKKKKQKKSDSSSSPSSVPVNIPSNVLKFNEANYDQSEEEYEDGDQELVPPHVIIGRRIFAGKMAFSVCTGNGRTLKGRDLSQVRNSILRLTGFLEA